MLIMTPDEIRKAESKADRAGLSYENMMENAGKGCAGYILEKFRTIKTAVILCGKGKNGGDGFVIARYLNKAGVRVSVIKAFDSPSDELSEKNRSRLPDTVRILSFSEAGNEARERISKSDIIIDAVFGIGFRGELPDGVKALFAEAEKSNAVKISVDIPSGLTYESSDTSCCFRADETLSMLCYKKEHIYKPWSSFCGKVTVIPIGFSINSNSLLKAADREDINSLLIKRPVISNKGTFGTALIAGGCYKMPGAEIIAVEGAVNSGAGLVCAAFPDKAYPAIAPRMKNAVISPLESDRDGGFSADADAFFEDNINRFASAAIGPGLGRGRGAERALTALVKNFRKTLIIDADGINILAGNINLLKESGADIILTPHPGEMARLTGLTVKEINSDRENIAREFAVKNNVILLLKGANTVIASPDGRCFINPTGSSALARGGSGDLLTGIIVSFACQGMKAFDAAVAAAYVHGLAGQMAGEKYTEYASSIDRITEMLPAALSEIIRGK